MRLTPTQALSNRHKIGRLVFFLLALVSLIGAGIVLFLSHRHRQRVLEDKKLLKELKRLSKTPFRVFGPIDTFDSSFVLTESSDLEHVSFTFFTRDDQINFLSEYGKYCQRGIATKATTATTTSTSPTDENLILKRYLELPDPYAVELWKYCVLYTGVGNVYWQTDNLVPLTLWQDILQQDHATENIAIEMVLLSDSVNREENDELKKVRLHHSFLRIAQPKSKVCLGLMRYLTEKKSPLSAIHLAETLGLYVMHDKSKKHKNNKQKQQQQQQQQTPWKLWKARCVDLGTDIEQTTHSDTILVEHRRTNKVMAIEAPQCPISHGGHCCQVWGSLLPSSSTTENLPIMVIRNPLVAPTKRNDHPLPFAFLDRSPSEMTLENLGMRVEDVPYVATVREYLTGAAPATKFETPNYFDILMENNCLPQDKDCFKCLKTGYKGEAGGDCDICASQCPCYCSALCQIRPPPKRLVGEWRVTRPRERRDPTRFVPRIIHQTWYEPVTKEKYPNMSRLIESWRQSGWQYEFYDDDRAGQFISANFPPQVREAYDAIIPGAFKADLFRYCVLLIMGGIYADMDILLESNLDEVIQPTVGFMTPQDSPGMTIGHRHCLWNGLMAAAPGHPFLAQTVQNVVNNVRNRFTNVDYDDMLCPDPVLAVSHTVDTLFTAGPCILGASLNDVLKHHRQRSFEYGDIDLFQSEHEKGKIVVDPDDPRFLIPGRSIILKQQKEDMGCHRFTWDEENMIVASTDMQDYDDRPPSLEHYSKTHEKFGVYGLHKLYTDSKRANEEFRVTLA